MPRSHYADVVYKSHYLLALGTIGAMQFGRCSLTFCIICEPVDLYPARGPRHLVSFRVKTTVVLRCDEHSE